VKVYKGETVAGGVALGRVYLQGWESDSDFPLRIPSDQVEHELNSLRRALDVSMQQMEDLKSKHEGNLGENELRIFDVHIAYLRDPMFLDKVEKLVMQERFSVRAAIRRVADDYDRIFQLVENDYLRQRAGDFRDVATRILRNLDSVQGAVQRAERPTGRYVLAARKLTVNDLFHLDNSQVEGIVAEEGGISSHAGILARSMGIPTITGIKGLREKLEDNEFVIIDAGAGELHVDPDQRLRAEYEEIVARMGRVVAAAPPGDLAHATRDGVAVQMLASCGNATEVSLARSFGMAGIGLYRTELMFMVGKQLPSEDLLMHHYREVLRHPDVLPVAFRLLDVAAGSGITGLPTESERNPALGMRGIRCLLGDDQTVLRLQLRAILRAAADTEDAAVLLPFVSSVAEIQRVKAAIVEERLELRKRKEPCADRLRVAPIIEVPAAAFVVEAFLNESDFLVVAIDDLQSLLLAADRDNQAVRDYCSVLHPAMFELLHRMARDAARHEKDLVLFGEGAADPVRIPFYLGVGIRSFSVAPVNLVGVLQVLQRFTIDECRRIAERLLEAPRALDVQRVLVRLVER
jgi:phosphoenolpyruvate-protein phosphotransferase